MEERIAAWLAARLPGARDIVISDLRQIPGGASRETWSFNATWRDPGGAGEEPRGYILRRDPDASLLVSDRELEYAIYQALVGTAVPAPRALWLETDPAWLERPFFVMERIDHCFAQPHILMSEKMARPREAVAEQKMAILARIHRITPEHAGLAVLGPAPESDACAERELAHWQDVITHEAIEPQPVLAMAHNWLRRHLPPPAARVVLVHGDYRTGNLLFDRRGQVRAVLDWEMAHWGDPVEDVAWLSIKSWRFAGNDWVGGVMPRSAALQRYAQASGQQVDQRSLHWWEMLGNLKLAAIFLTGARSFMEGRSTDLQMAIVGRMLPPLELELLKLMNE